MIWKIAGMYPIQNTNIVKTVIEYLWKIAGMYPIQNTNIVKTVIEYLWRIAGCILYRILTS